MNASAGMMMAPSLIVLGVVGWACWSHLDVADPAAPAKVKFEPIVASQPSLELRIAGARNPFLLPSRVAAVKAAAATKGARSRSWGDRWKQLTQALNRPGASPAKAAEDQHAKARTVLQKLALGGTSVGGDRKVAILAGRAYAEGDAIEGIDRALGQVVLSEVRATEVILNCPAGLVTVTFPDASRPSTAPKGSSAPMVALKRPSRARTKSTTPTMRGKAR
jgi:hypothetical protein